MPKILPKLHSNSKAPAPVRISFASAWTEAVNVLTGLHFPSNPSLCFLHTEARPLLQNAAQIQLFFCLVSSSGGPLYLIYHPESQPPLSSISCLFPATPQAAAAPSAAKPVPTSGPLHLPSMLLDDSSPGRPHPVTSNATCPRMPTLTLLSEDVCHLILFKALSQPERTQCIYLSSCLLSFSPQGHISPKNAGAIFVLLSSNTAPEYFIYRVEKTYK